MTFVFPLLLGGLVLAGIPVLLHLIVRQKPKRLAFPAFRFLVQQQRSNQRKLRLRHLLLLALRVLLIAAMCLLLARPRLFHRVLGLDGERPVQAVLLFDTSASMEYRSSDGVTRLDEAQQRARQLLDELPAGSQVAVVDSADARFEQPLEWRSLLDARKQIDGLKIRYANVTVTQALLKALTRLDQPATDADRPPRTGPARLRLLAVFSDRTRGSWDGTQVPALVDKLDRIGPAYEGLLAARGQIGTLRDQLAALPSELPPPAGKEYGEQALLEALTALQNDLVGLTAEPERWPVGLPGSVQQVRRLSRDLRGQLAPAEPSPGDAAPAFRDKLRTALAELLRATAGVQLLYFDVGIAAPNALALGPVELPRTTQGLEQQQFADGDAFTLNAVVQATGKDAAATVVCQVGEARQEMPVALKAGERQTVPFRIGAGKLLLKPGDNPIELYLDAKPEALPHAHHRFATVRVRPKRKVLVLVDDVDRAKSFTLALASLGYAPDVRLARELSKDALAGAAAVYLLGVAAPPATTWTILGDYVKAGGGLGIVPAGADMSLNAYSDKAAQLLMPGKLEGKLDGKQPGGSDWDWNSGKYDHSFMKRFKAWKDYEFTDFIRLRRGAFHYWDVTPQPGGALVLVRYNDANHKPAVLDRVFDAKSGVQGKTLLFTTPLDDQQPPWNNYLESVSPSFYLALVLQGTGYLAGETMAPQLNFILGQGDAVVVLPPGPPLELVAMLRGRELFRPVTVEPGQPQLVLKDLGTAGNFQLDAKTKDGREVPHLAGFSLNVPASESDLTQVPATELDPLFAGVLALGRDGSLHEALESYRSEPLDLMPYFMLALLFALALENLLANKFYREAAT